MCIYLELLIFKNLKIVFIYRKRDNHDFFEIYNRFYYKFVKTPNNVDDEK